MSDQPASADAVATASITLLSHLILVLLQQGLLSKADLATIFDGSYISLEEQYGDHPTAAQARALIEALALAAGRAG